MFKNKFGLFELIVESPPLSVGLLRPNLFLNRPLEQQVQQIRATGEIAPPACHVARYQVKRPNQSYWYYKLHASDPIFKRANRSRKLSKYKHLGKGGSAAHVEAVMQVTRRILIDELQQAIYTLQQVLLDLGNNSAPEGKSSASQK